MARKRKKALNMASQQLKTKPDTAPKVPTSPKKPEPFPDKALVKVFHNLDIITATSFGLACQKFRDIYHKHSAEVFKDAKCPRPISLELRIQCADGTGYCLKECLKSWMPAHLTYDDYAKKFVTVDNLGKAFLKDIGALEEDKETRLKWQKTQNEMKQRLMEDKSKLMEDIGQGTENMDFSWEMQAMGVDSMELELELESDNTEEARPLAELGGTQRFAGGSM